MTKDYYIQPDARDPVLSGSIVIRNPDYCEVAKEDLDQILNEFQEKENIK